MSVYRVYTKKALVPTYVLYRCPKCQRLVAAKGGYGFSTSYTDRGTWTSKGVQKRAASATAELETTAGGMQHSLREHAMQLPEEDFRQIVCACPQCGHPSLGKLGDIEKLDKRITLGLVAALVVIAAVYAIVNKPSSSELLGLLLFALIAAGLLSMVCKAILQKVDKGMSAGNLRATAPLISANKECLMNEAKKNAAYRDADYSAIEKQPDIL